MRRFSILNTTEINNTDNLTSDIGKYMSIPVKTLSSSLILEDSFQLSYIENKENVLTKGNCYIIYSLVLVISNFIWLVEQVAFIIFK